MERFLARDDDDWDDADDEFDSEEDDKSTIACPNCHKQVYDDAEQCPYCGHYISDQDWSSGKPLLVVVGMILCLLVVFYWLIV
jgi:uncharacterized protein (DUF983 family)